MRYLTLPIAIILVAFSAAVVTACAVNLGPDGLTAGPAASTSSVGKVATELQDETAERVEADEQLRDEMQRADSESAAAMRTAFDELMAGRDPTGALEAFRSRMAAEQERVLAEARNQHEAQLRQRDAVIENLKREQDSLQTLMWILFGTTTGGGVLGTVLAAKGGRKAERNDIATGIKRPVPIGPPTSPAAT